MTTTLPTETATTDLPDQTGECERPPLDRNRRLIDLLDSWVDVSDDEAEEQRETLVYLQKALDRRRNDRASMASYLPLLVSRKTEVDFLHGQAARLGALLDAWSDVTEEEAEEQRETLEILRRALTDHPLSDRPRF